MKFDRDSEPFAPAYHNGKAVEFQLIDKTPLGYKALVEGRHSGLLYRDSISSPVAIGQTIKGFVRTVRPDGKIDLSLEQPGYRRVAPLADQIVQELERNSGRLDFDDNSPSEAIRQRFRTSKKAFKQALGTLYKARRIEFSKPGIQLLDNTTWSPGPRESAKLKARSHHHRPGGNPK
jgi:predicted RNA-binding protein (virulence factor B family)